MIDGNRAHWNEFCRDNLHDLKMEESCLCA